jgi:hypothetical protein
MYSDHLVSKLALMYLTYFLVRKLTLILACLYPYIAM